MAGSRGPLGKPHGTKLGHGNGKANEPDVTLLQRSKRVNWYTANPDWHAEARQMYDGLKKSAPAKLFEPSDVAVAYFVCSQMHRFIETGRTNGQMFSAIMSAIENLMATEGARRRLRVEIVDSLPDDQKSADDPIAAMMADYAASLKAA